MDFDLTSEQKEIKAVARELLAERSPFPKVREAAEAAAYDERLWRELVELGWPGIAVAESDGGQGLGAVELGVLLEELGYACAATPFLSTATVAALIGATGSDEQRARWLPGLCSGDITAGLGTRELAADAAEAAVIVLLDGDEARARGRRDAEATPLTMIDGTRRFATVAGDGVPLGAGAAAGRRGRRGRAGRRLPARARDDGGLRQGPKAVRGPGRLLPGRLAPLRGDAAADGERPLHRAVCGVGGGCGAGPAGGGRRTGRGRRGRRRARGHRQRDPGPRRVGFTWEADVHWLYKRAQLDAALLGGARRHRAALARIVAGRLAAAAA